MADYGREPEFGVGVEPLADPPGWAARIPVAGETGGDVLIAGNLSETWGYDPGNPSTHRHVREMFDRQLAVMTEEGVDFVIAETFLWVGEALIAAEAIKDANLTGMVTMAFADEPVPFEGLTPGECVRRLADAGVEITGVNCLRSPEHILPIMEEMRCAAPDSVYLATQPVAFHGPHAHPNFTALPGFPFGLEKITLPRTAFGDFAVKARDLGFSYIGSCCGAVACHVREMARALGKVPAGEREWRSQTGRPMSGLELHQPEGR